MEIDLAAERDGGVSSAEVKEKASWVMCQTARPQEQNGEGRSGQRTQPLSALHDATGE